MSAEHTYFYDTIKITAEKLPDKVTFRRRDKDGNLPGKTFGQIKSMIDELTAGLIDFGIKKGDKITFLCDSSTHWYITDVAIVSAGAVSVPRGTDVTEDDIEYIVNHSDSEYAIVQKAADKERLEKMADRIANLRHVFVMEDADGNLLTSNDSIHSLMDKGRALLVGNANVVQERVDSTDPNELATLIYTSGTTGAPKGVMLSQTCWLTAFDNSRKNQLFTDEDSSVSLLPPWHAFERSVEYAAVIMGNDFLISNIQNLRDDLKDFKPTVLPSVPRIWEALYNGIQDKLAKESGAKQGIFNFFLSIGWLWATRKAVLFGYAPAIKRPFFLFDWLNRLFSLIVLILIAPLKFLATKVFSPIHQGLGGRLNKSISGGSALAKVIDRFFTSIGVKVLEGYGLTETSAVITLRDFKRPTSGSVGRPLPGYTIKLKDENGKELEMKPGVKGTLWAKSGQLLSGYYKRPELNEVVFDKDGFFDTGDLMMTNYRGELMFAGRSKDTIALAGGENIEPVPIEDKLMSSKLIDQVMVIGDDKKSLGALIVPNFEQVKGALEGAPEDHAKWNTDKPVRDLFKNEIGQLVNTNEGFKSFEVVPKNCFFLVSRQFDPDTEMTRTMKMKRPVIKEHFASEIDALY